MSQAVSPVTGAEALAAVKQLVLDSVSSPLTRVMYARALEDFFGWWTGQFTRAAVQAWRAVLEAKGLAPASINQKLSSVRKLAVEAAYNGLLDPAAAQRGVRTGNWLTKRQAEGCSRRPRLLPTRENGTARPSWRCWSAASCSATKPSG